MKKLIIILVLLILLGGCGAAAWWFFLRPPEDGAEAVVEEAPPQTLSQIVLTTFGVTLVKDSVAKREFLFDLSLTFDDPEKEAWTEARLPLVQDAIVTELHGLLPRKIVEQGAYNIDFLRERLLKMLAERFGEDRIHDVTIRNMTIRDLQ